MVTPIITPLSRGGGERGFSMGEGEERRREMKKNIIYLITCAALVGIIVKYMDYAEELSKEIELLKTTVEFLKERA